MLIRLLHLGSCWVSNKHCLLAISYWQYSGWPLVRKKSGKSYFPSRTGKSQGICKMVTWAILNTKKVREKSRNFLILAKNCLAVAGNLSILND